MNADKMQRHGNGDKAHNGKYCVAYGVAAHTFSERSSPIKPLGRTSRIRIMAINAKESLYSVMPANTSVRGNNAVKKFSKNPSNNPPSTAPGSEPMPPITAAENAL